MTEDTSRLADHALIDGAVAVHQRALARLAQAEAELAAADAAHAAAREASEAAVAGQGATTPMAAEMQLEKSARTLAVATKVRDAAACAVASALSGIDTARDVAHRPLYTAGIAGRLAAASRADAARAELAAAQRDHEAAIGLLNEASRAGTQGVIYDPSHGSGSPVGTYADELARWSRPNGWWHGMPLTVSREAA